MQDKLADLVISINNVLSETVKSLTMSAEKNYKTIKLFCITLILCLLIMSSVSIYYIYKTYDYEGYPSSTITNNQTVEGGK